ALALALLWLGDFAPRTQWTLTSVVVVAWLAIAATLREHVIRPLQTVSNMLAALRERDFSMRARGSNPTDAPGLLLLELNGLGACFTADAPGVVDLELAGARGRWEVRRGTFRQEGLPHELLVLADVSRTLSREERQAWQRLIRVLGHELNNSLAPIKSLAQSLAELVRRDPPPPDWRTDLENGLGVIASRAESLSRLMAAYAQL